MPDHVMLAVDGGSADDVAERWVVQHCRRVPTDVEVTTVLEHVPMPHARADIERGRREARLAAIADRLRSAAQGTPVRIELRYGNVTHQLIEATRADTILVVGMTHVDPVDEVAHLPLGLRLAHLPLGLRLAGRTRGVLVVVPTGWTGGGHGVVVGWDTGESGEAVLAFATRAARREDRELAILHARHDGVPRRLEVEAERIRASHPEVDVRVLRADPPAATALLDAARDAALVVVGSRGPSALADLLGRSVSEYVLARATFPVAVVPAPEAPIEVAPEIVDEQL